MARIALVLLTFIMLGLKTAVVPVQAQSDNGISEPASGSEISGIVSVVGTASHPDYLRYELAFRHVSDPAADWIVFAEGSEPVVNGSLAVWDTTVGRDIGAPVFPDGRYQLRLRVVKNDYNYDEYFVSDLLIVNDEPTPTPTSAGTIEALPTSTAQAATAVFQPNEPLPSLTPFPTSTPLPGPAETATPVAAIGGSEESSGGLFGQLATVDTGRFGRAFGLGVGFVGFLFGLLAFYLLIRAIGRRLWHLFWTRKQQ
ncbi:MAG: hypothetical protein CSB13_07175 [Chloroflexi bacterium]|nr:MAG: hypothetical protein CSB13_07175 [Chloroflexota bacterium]